MDEKGRHLRLLTETIAAVNSTLDLEEVLSLADRILVIYEGRIVREYSPDVTEEELGIAMTGGHREEVTA